MPEADDDLKPVIGRYRVSDQDADAELAKNSVRARLFGGKKKKTRLGKYVLGKLIGVGGMGRVYVAHDRELDRKVALKLLKGSQWTGEGGEEGRLWREARTLAQINHRNVVSVYEVGKAQMGVFVAMEFIDGRTLRQWVNDEDPNPKAVIEVLREAGSGLVAAHGAGIVHRDFKPDNVLIGKDGRVCVVDFGIAYDVAELGLAPAPEDYGTATGRERLMTSGPAGTPAYMAPERIDGRDADVAGDIYSFCVSAWEALTGCLPDPYSRSPPPDSRRVIPRALRSALERGLHHEPSKRQASVRILLDAFDRVLHRRQRSRLVWAGGGVLLAGAAVGALLRAPANAPLRSNGTHPALETTPSTILPQRPLAGRIGVSAVLSDPFETHRPPALVRLQLDPAQLLATPSDPHEVEPAWSPTLHGYDVDAIVATLRAHNVDVVPTLLDAYPSADLSADDPAAWTTHATLAYALTQRYRDASFVGHGFAHTNANRLTPPECAAMASAAFDGHRGTLGSIAGIKTADPSRLVVLDAIGHDMTRADMWGDRVIDYLDGVRAWSSTHREGSFPADVIGLHVASLGSGAPERSTIVQQLEAIVRWRNAQLPDRELWVTSMAVHAQWVVRGYLTMLATGIDRVTLASWSDVKTSTAHTSNGLLGPAPAHDAKPAMRMLATLDEQLGAFTLESRLDALPPNVWALRFRGPSSQRAVVAWRGTANGGSTSNVLLPIPSGTARLIPLSGASNEVQARDGLRIDVHETPTIILFEE